MEVFLIVSSEGVSVNKPISGKFYHSMSPGNALPWREERKGEKRNKLSIKKIPPHSSNPPHLVAVPQNRFNQ